jgi:hypothetical protein
MEMNLRLPESFPHLHWTIQLDAFPEDGGYITRDVGHDPMRVPGAAGIITSHCIFHCQSQSHRGKTASTYMYWLLQYGLPRWKVSGFHVGESSWRGAFVTVRVIFRKAGH